MEYTKRDGRAHWHFEVDPLGTDRHGSWYAGRPGIQLQKAAEPPIEEVDGFVMLVPASGDWIAFWNRQEEPAIYVDVTTTPACGTHTVTAVDMDLDVLMWWDGRVTEEDRDEFELHQKLMAYPDQLLAGAEATARWLEETMTHRRPPFDETGPRWLEVASVDWGQPDQPVNAQSRPSKTQSDRLSPDE